MIARFLFLILLMTPLLANAAGRVFYDGFESGNTSLWSNDGSRVKCQAVTSPGDGGVGPQAGSWLGRCNYNGTLEWNDDNRYESMGFPSVSGTELFYRIYLRISTNLASTGAGGDNTGPKLLRFYNPSGYAAFLDLESVNPSTSPATIQWAHELPGTSTMDWGMASASRTAWTKVEMYFNASTNQHRIWINDSLVRDTTASNVSGVASAPLYLGSNWSGGCDTCREHDATNHVYWDEAEIYSSSASGATGSMVDGTITQSGGGDTTAPSVTISASDPSAITSDALTASFAASDAVGVSSCKWRIGSAPNGSTGTACTGTTSGSCSTSGYSSGANTLYVGCGDAAGNWGSDSITVNYTPPGDTTPPTVSMTAPANGATVSGSVTVSADCTDNIAVASVQFRRSGTNIGSADTTAPYSVTWNTTTTTDGSHSLTAICTDTSANSTTSAARSVTVSNAPPADTTPPVVSGLLPTTGYPAGTTSVTAQASTDEAATCRQGSANDAWGSMTAYSTTGGISHATSIAVRNGLVRQICTRCRDAAANESAIGCVTTWVADIRKRRVRR